MLFLRILSRNHPFSIIQKVKGTIICFLATRTIWSNYRYKRTRIHLHTGPQVRHARRVVHCLKSVKTGNCLRAVQETKVHKTDELNSTDELKFLPGILLVWDPRTSNNLRKKTQK